MTKKSVSTQEMAKDTYVYAATIKRFFDGVNMMVITSTLSTVLGDIMSDMDIPENLAKDMAEKVSKDALYLYSRWKKRGIERSR